MRRFDLPEPDAQDYDTSGPFPSFTDLLSGILLIFIIMVALLALSQGIPAVNVFSDLPKSPTGGGSPIVQPKANGGIGNTPVIRFNRASQMVFDPDSADLLDEGRAVIAQVLPRVARMVAERSANQLTIVGSTSPTPRDPRRAAINRYDASDSNIDLSALRALAIAHYLSSVGVPYRCMTVEGLGYSRTQMPEGVEKSYGHATKPQTREIELRYGDERAVSIFVDRTESTCSTGRLLQSLRAAQPR